jgi:hypothetical protein
MVSQGARKNGLTLPLQPFQIISWLLFILFVAVFYTLVFLYPGTVGRAVAGALFGVLTLLTALAAGAATTINPADVKIYGDSPQDPRAVIEGQLVSRAAIAGE